MARWYNYKHPEWYRYHRADTAAVAAVLTGTAVPSATDAEIVTGGETIIITLTGDTWVASGGTFDGIRQDIIDGLVAASSPLLGWNNVVVALQGVGGVVRTSDTVVTITLDAFVTYAPGDVETVTGTVPSTAVVGAGAIIATPTFQVVEAAGGLSIPIAMSHYMRLAAA